MTRRNRWLLALTATLSFAAGFVLAQAMFSPAPARPDVSGVPGEPCTDYPGGFVGLHEGRVAVFEGEPGGCHRLVEETSIERSNLHAFQVTDLERGIAFEDEAELFQILEGLMGP
ncbi:MAG: BofC C-terminal domain-containing protein [Firmicutes bacterium]|nr:BofC C-terminal domain-containing protein [Bacillota bacterium]